MSNRPVHALVLAGGQSRRMGRDKAGLVLAGKPQLEHVVELLTPVVDKVWVSVRKHQPADPLRDAYPQIVDREEDAGPVAGILAALEAHPDVDWLVVAVDLPNLDRQTLEYLLEHASDPRFTAYRSVRDGLPEPLCALYRPEALAVIRGFVDEGIVCPRKILIRSDAELLTQPTPGALENVNTPDDLALVGLDESAA
jgi:molybdopterin-guanine dinucleotide biosynthesis protein A